MKVKLASVLVSMISLQPCGYSKSILLFKGEECDCGEPEICYNKCCDPTTCKLVKNKLLTAECNTGFILSFN